MFCKNCGNELTEGAMFCMKCGFKNGNGDQYCPTCGETLERGQGICVKCGYVIDDVEHVDVGHDKYIPMFKKEKYLSILSAILSIFFIASLIFMPIFKFEVEIDSNDFDELGDLSFDDFQNILKNDGVLVSNFSFFDDIISSFDVFGEEDADQFTKFFSFFLIALFVFMLIPVISSLKNLLGDFKSLEGNSSYAEKRYKHLKSVFTDTNIYNQARENSKLNGHIAALVMSFFVLFSYLCLGLTIPSNTADEFFYVPKMSSISIAIIVPIILIVANFCVAHLRTTLRDKIKEEILEIDK